MSLFRFTAMGMILGALSAIQSSSSLAAAEWPRPVQCKNTPDQILEIKNLMSKVCPIDGQAAHICGSDAKVVNAKDGSLVSQLKLNAPLTKTLSAVITHPRQSQVHRITEDGEIQKFDAQTNDLRSVKLRDILKHLQAEKKLDANLVQALENDKKSGSEISDLASKIKFSDDGKYLILPNASKSAASENRISLSDIFDSSTPQSRIDTPHLEPFRFDSNPQPSPTPSKDEAEAATQNKNLAESTSSLSGDLKNWGKSLQQNMKSLFDPRSSWGSGWFRNAYSQTRDYAHQNFLPLAKNAWDLFHSSARNYIPLVLFSSPDSSSFESPTEQTQSPSVIGSSFTIENPTSASNAHSTSHFELGRENHLETPASRTFAEKIQTTSEDLAKKLADQILSKLSLSSGLQEKKDSEEDLNKKDPQTPFENQNSHYSSNFSSNSYSNAETDLALGDSNHPKISDQSASDLSDAEAFDLKQNKKTSSTGHRPPNNSFPYLADFQLFYELRRRSKFE